MGRDLVEAAAWGDHEAFEVLATSAGGRLFAVAQLVPAVGESSPRTRSRRHSSAPGESCRLFPIRTGSMPGYIASW
jgi:hypothetical protein